MNTPPPDSFNPPICACCGSSAATCICAAGGMVVCEDCFTTFDAGGAIAPCERGAACAFCGRSDATAPLARLSERRCICAPCTALVRQIFRLEREGAVAADGEVIPLTDVGFTVREMLHRAPPQTPGG